MSGIEMAVIITFVTAAGLAAAYRAIAVASVFTLNDLRGKYKRRKYRKKMKKGMKECNYKLFKEAIYDIKNYDMKFEKSYYNEMKKNIIFMMIMLIKEKNFMKDLIMIINIEIH
jgi:hypothetical protein